MSLASVKSRLDLPFWYRLTRVVLEKWPLSGCVCVCVIRLLDKHVDVRCVPLLTCAILSALEMSIAHFIKRYTSVLYLLTIQQSAK